jgi:fatty acid amide hydrolase
MGIHELTATDLLRHLDAGELSSSEIVEALDQRRRDVDPKINAIVVCREQAMAEAKAADEARARGDELGPLHGLPITIKENIDLEGTDSTLGLQSRRGQPSSRDAVLAEQLRRKGAIVIAKTNVPQLLLAQETENALFGVTNNPWNTGRVPGGSSGGEGAAVASGMSPLGIGTDIGGSIRIPAHFCGVVGFKPTLDRWSNRGSNTAIKGQELVRSQIGCLTRSVADASMLWRALDPIEMSVHDPLVAPVPATDPNDIDLEGLTIGYVEGDSFLEPVASIKRGLDRAREVLEAAGAKLVPHTPVPTDEVVFVWLGAISADGGRTIGKMLEGEPISPQLKPSLTLLKLPSPLRRVAGRLVQRLGEDRVSRLLATLGEKTVDQVWQLTQRRTELRNTEFDSWRQAGIDALICPPHVVPALGHRESGDFAMSLGSEFRWTLVNFPAGVVPVTTARSAEVGRYEQKDRVERKVASIDKRSVGLPVGVQVVAPPYMEHVLLRVMQAIEDGVRDDDGYPATPIDPRGES